MTEPTTEPTDEALMACYQGGDRAAFNLLFVRHARTLFTSLWYVLLDEEQATELACQTWRWVHRSRRDRRPQETFVRWIYTQAMSLRREAGRALPISASQPSAASPTRDGTPLLRVLRDLPESYREVIVLQQVARLSDPDIARILGATEEAVLQRARQGDAQFARAAVRLDAPALTSPQLPSSALTSLALLPVAPATLDRIARAVLPDLSRPRQVQRIPSSWVISGLLLCLCLALLLVHFHP